MSVGVRGRLLARDAHDALLGLLDALLLAPSGDAGVGVPAQIVGARRPFRLTQLPVCGPRLVVDADYAARGSLRRHGHSVADRAMTRHLSRDCRIGSESNWISNDLLVTGHPGVGSNRIQGTSRALSKPP